MTDDVAQRKSRRTLTLDADLVAEFGGGDGDRRLSPEVNAILRAEKTRRERARALEALLNRLEAERGPVDPAEVTHFEALLR